MPRSRTALVAVLLAVTLALTVLLATNVLYAVRGHRVAAESALREYARFAASEFERRSRQGFYDALLFGLLRPAIAVNIATPGGALPAPRLLADAAPAPRGRDLRASGLVRSYFLLHLAAGQLDTAGTMDAGEAKWIADRVPWEGRILHDSGAYYGFMVGAPSGAVEGATYILKLDATNQPVVAYGAVFAIDALRPVFDDALARPLLPRIAAGVPNDSLLAVRVTSADGAVVYASRAPFDERLSAEIALGHQLGSLRVRVAARPDAAARLLVGGLPDSRGPFVASLVALCALLLGVTLVLLRRESELSRMRSDFVANVSHELRTPLAQIRMFSETLLLGRVRSDGERTRSLEIVHQEATRLSHLVENLLHFSRGERSSDRLALQGVDVAPFVRDVVAGFTPIAAAHGATIAIAVGGGDTVRADPDALRQMLLNLLDNTVKYGPNGQVITVGSGVAEGMITIHVDDEGPGVPEAERTRVFERFARVEGEGPSVAGTGIGLAVVADLSRRQGGRAWVERAPGGGARFVIALPIATGELPS